MAYQRVNPCSHCHLPPSKDESRPLSLYKESKSDELLAIDPAQFREFYGHFADGRSADPSGVQRYGKVCDRINKALVDHLGSPPGSGRKSYWLGSKSTLEEWKTAKTIGVTRERKVLKAIYDLWNFDISLEQRFLNSVDVEPAIRELLKIDGVQFESLPEDGCRKAILRLKKIELMPKTRRVAVPGASGRSKEIRARLGFSEVSLRLVLPDGVEIMRVPLVYLVSEQGSQFGASLGMTIICAIEDLQWRLIGTNRNSGMMIASLANAQLVEVLVREDGVAKFTVQVAKADFDPEILLEDSTGDTERDRKQQILQKELLIAHLLRRRFESGEQYVLASGKLKL